jgi:hypothetical protein
VGKENDSINPDQARSSHLYRKDTAGLKALRGPDFDALLSEKGKSIPAGDAKYIFRNAQ